MSTITHPTHGGPIEHPMPEAVYHARPEVSRSFLKDFLRSRVEAYQRHISRQLEPIKATDKLQIGTGLHALLLEPHRFKELVAEIPDRCLKSNGHRNTAGKEWKAFAAANEGKALLKAEEVDAIRKMQHAIMSLMEPFLSAGDVQIERPVFWRDDDSGLHCRCRPDLRIPRDEQVYVIDVKTTGMPLPQDFWRTARQQRYWLQAVHYCRGVEAIFGRPAEFYFAVVGVEPPHHARFYSFDFHDLQAGHQRYDELLSQVAACYESGDWTDPDAREIHTLSISEKELV